MLVLQVILQLLQVQGSHSCSRPTLHVHHYQGYTDNHLICFVRQVFGTVPCMYCRHVLTDFAQVSVIFLAVLVVFQHVFMATCAIMQGMQTSSGDIAA